MDTNKEFEAIMAECRDLFAKKLHDYGASWRILRPSSLTDQLFIKAKRIRSLEIKKESKVGEGIRPEFIALINYGIVGLIQTEKGFADTVDITVEEALSLYDRYANEALELMKRKNHDYDEAWRAMRVPLSALDAKLRASLLLDLDALHDKIGITFIYVTHDQSEALAVSDRIAVMNKGKVLQVGTPFEIYESPATQFVAEFIGETNLFEATVAECVPYKNENGMEEFMCTCSVPALGKQAPLPTDSAELAATDKYMMVTDYDHTEPGQKVAFTIRPEKIRITTDIPDVHGRKDINVFKGIVEEPVYTGFQSKFYVRLENGAVLKVFQQHRNFMDDGPDIAWKDTVYVSWAAEDGYIVEDIEK